MIRRWSVQEEYEAIAPEIEAAVKEVFSSGRLILGPHVASFEEKFSRYCGSAFGVGVSSGTDAIFLALKSLGIGPGDEVVTVSYTAVATISAIRLAGATPVFVDIDEETYGMEVSQVESACTTRTKALLPVHLYGQAVDLDPLLNLARSRGLAVIEDCAHSHGCTYRGKRTGTWGTIGAFSFYPTKVLGAYGDAGICVTDSEELDQRLRQLRQYGMTDGRLGRMEGYNTRMDEVQAAILEVKLRTLDEMIARRRQIAKRYDEALGGLLGIPAVKPYSSHSYYLYVVRHPDRDAIIAKLRERGIEVDVHFGTPIHRMEAFQFLGYREGSLPVTERVAKEVFSLPMHPFLKEEAVEGVVTALKEILS